MKTLQYILIFIMTLPLMFSCESEYDKGIDSLGTVPAYISLSSTSTQLTTETKSFIVSVRKEMAIYEDVTIHYSVSGETFSTISGTAVYPANKGEKGEDYFIFTVDLVANMVTGTDVSTTGTFSLDTCTTASGKIVTGGLQGTDKTLPLIINKYVPLDRSLFLGSYLENDGSDDYAVTIAEDPENEFGLVITGGNWADDAYYTVVFNTITGETVVSDQYIHTNYSGYPEDTYQVFYSPASDGSTGTFDLNTGNFSVMINMNMPNYPYDFGDYELTYTKQ